MALLILPAACVYGVLMDCKLRRERYYGTPLEDASVRVVLAQDGFEVEAGGSLTRVPWSALRRACVFEDGWLLEEFGGPRRGPRGGRRARPASAGAGGGRPPPPTFLSPPACPAA